jgi:steroid 5-alpha reductase family enzyme
MSRAFRAVAVAYALALGVAVLAGFAVPCERPLWIALAGDVAATFVVFAFSVAFRNSSFYDAYWSVAPLAIAVYWALFAESAAVSGARQAVVLLLIGWWGVRLTWNWARGWQGLSHEDWRYVDLQRQHGRAYWAVSFSGLHMMPTLIVFAGLLPAYAALSLGTRPWGWLDGVALAVTGAAILCEQVADRQLLRFRRSSPGPEAVLQTGLWAWSRHPNYLGEMGFWWGLFLFGLAARPGWWWAGVGALAISVMFRTVSLPLIETRMQERRPGYADVQRRISMVLPRPPRAA